MQSFFRIDSSEDDARKLVDERNPTSEPWGEPREGPCDKCGGSGRTRHVCESCKEGPAVGDCPSCHGEISYERECPACEGTGVIDDVARHGVSVFPDEDGLYRYMLRREADLEDCVLVELTGRETGDEDFDADEGALLIHPQEVVDIRKPDGQRLRELRSEADISR